MATVSQTIPNYYGGLSEQPDELKIPGQVNKLINTLPDITHGLMKRPGGRLIGGSMSSYTTDSKWFHYYRDENEQYIGQLDLSEGSVRMWALTKVVRTDGSTVHEAGDRVNVWLPNRTITVRAKLLDYLKQTSDADAGNIQTLTLNDSTYITNRTVDVEMASTVAPVRPPEAYIELKKVAYANQYSLNLFDDTDLTSISTATRLSIDVEIDSSNACDDDGLWPSHGNLPGSSGDKKRCDNTNTGGHNKHDDDTLPNVGTKIFAVDHMTENFEEDSAEGKDANKTAWKHDVTPITGTAADRKNLFFRLTCTGQPVAQGDSNNPEYFARYTVTHDLLYGGEGWLTGDYFYV